MEYRLLPFAEQDEPFLKDLYFEVRKPEFLSLGLPEAALAQLLEMQYRAQRSGYAQQFPSLESSVVWVGPYRVGRMLVSPGAEAIHLVDIALLEAFRGHGIGSRLIESLRRRALEAGVPLRLSVRQENRALTLYTRLGFTSRGSNGLYVEMEWGRAAPQESPGCDSIQEAGPIVPGPNGAYFRSICGSRVIAQNGPVEKLVLKLASVRPLRRDPNPGVSMGDSFALTFAGDSSAMLAQGTYNLQFEDGNRMDIFLVPIAAAKGVATYESIFNRMSRPTPVVE
jgi:GNAT superfamily N-acetyltransferase